MKFLGLRLCEHDSNISYSDGNTVKYYQAERDLQFKHYGYRDLVSWKKVFDSWGLIASDIDCIGIVLDCFRHKHIKTDESKLYEVLDIPLFESLGFNCPVYRINHHYAHALSVWTLDNIQSDVDLVFDGFGDDQVSHTIFKGNDICLELRNDTHPSIGQTLGTVGRHYLELDGHILDLAGKIMAMKAYGKPYKFDRKFTLSDINTLWKREPYNIQDHIATAHLETERVFVEHFLKHTKEDDIITYSGGVAQNTIINSRIKEVRPNLFIPPHCNDSGLSLGIVEFFRRMYDQEPFDTSGFPFWQSDVKPEEEPSTSTIKQTAEKLAKGEIVGWYQGHGEVGPRALGNRSILMNPSIKDGKDKLNSKVKHREWYRPFGASVLEDKALEYFSSGDSPYMLYVVDVLDKESFPAITHADGTCRPQTVSSTHEIYYELISEFEKLTGIPMLLNTSLNNGGKPICGSPNDALELLSRTEMDSLVIGNTIY